MLGEAERAVVAGPERADDEEADEEGDEVRDQIGERDELIAVAGVNSKVAADEPR